MAVAVRTLENFIGGRWVAATADDSVDDVNPADPADVLATVPLSSAKDADRAIAAAADAFPAWRAMSPIRRGQILLRAARILEDRTEELARLLTREQGKTLAEARGEVPRAFGFFGWIGNQGGSIQGITAPTESDRILGLTLREPLGVVGLITPWNFPLNIPSWKLGSSLVCGNTVVLKPAQVTPLMRERAHRGAGRGRHAGRRRQSRPRQRVGRRSGARRRPTGAGYLVHGLDRGRHGHQRQGGALKARRCRQRWAVTTP